MMNILENREIFYRPKTSAENEEEIMKSFYTTRQLRLFFCIGRRFH